MSSGLAQSHTIQNVVEDLARVFQFIFLLGFNSFKKYNPKLVFIVAESHYKKGLNLVFLLLNHARHLSFPVNTFLLRLTLGVFCVLKSFLTMAFLYCWQGFIRGVKLASPLFALPLTAGRILFWKLLTGTNGERESTTINFTFNHEMKSQQEVGVYGWSGNWRSAASLFLTTALAYAKSNIFGKEILLWDPGAGYCLGEA